MEKGHGNVEPLHKDVKAVHKRKTQTVERDYPHELKQLTLEILIAYKETLPRVTGKRRVGWTVVRNLIMKEADDIQLSGHDSRLSRDDLENWARGKSTPNNDKFGFIDKFVKGLEISGDLSDIRRSINRIKHHHRRTFIDRLFASPYPFKDKNSKDYKNILSELSDTFWISSATDTNLYKQFLLYIGHADGHTFDAMAIYFPRSIDIESSVEDLSGTFACGGAIMIDTLKGGPPEAPTTTPYHFARCFTILLFRDENRGGEDAPFTTAELEIDPQRNLNIKWGRPITAPSIVDYMYHTGLSDPSPLGNQMYRASVSENETLYHPLSGKEHRSIYIGVLKPIGDNERVEELRAIFNKFEV